jgi:P pilus assembly chaperone PapD
MMSKPIVALALVASIFMGVPAHAEFTPWATRVLYNRLTPGMTTKTVLNMMGSEPAKVTEYTEIGSRYAVYQWVNPDSSTMSLLFKDNQLLSKSAHFRPTLGATN